MARQYRIKSLLVVTGCIGIALALIPVIGEEASAILLAVMFLFATSALTAWLFGAKSIAMRVLTNALIGAFAGALPGYAFLISMEADGLGGLAALAATASKAGLGLVAGTIGSACSIGLRVFSSARVAKVLVATCLGAMLAASAGWLILGIDNETKVVSVLVLSVLGLLTGMLLSTDRKQVPATPSLPGPSA